MLFRSNRRAEKKIDNAAIIRVEQLYPLHETKLKSMMKAFPKSAQLVWCQEEPENMGAWSFIEPRLRKLLAAMSPTLAATPAPVPRSARSRDISANKPASSPTRSRFECCHSERARDLTIEAGITQTKLA